MTVSSRTFQNDRMQVNMTSLGLIAGTVVLASTPTILTGRGFTVSTPSTGVYRITPNQKCPHFISVVGNLVKLAATTEARWLSTLTWTDSNGYVEFRVEDSSGAAAAPTATDAITFTVVAMLVNLPKA